MVRVFREWRGKSGLYLACWIKGAEVRLEGFQTLNDWRNQNNVIRTTSLFAQLFKNIYITAYVVFFFLSFFLFFPLKAKLYLFDDKEYLITDR